MSNSSSSASSSSSSSIYQKIAEKRINLEKLREFKQLTSDLVIQLESIGNKLENMNEGTASVGLILSNWQSVIKSISLASLALVNNQEDQDTRNYNNNNNNQQDDKFPEPLVRIKLDQSNQNNDHQDRQQEDIGELEDDEELEQEEVEVEYK